MSSLSSRKNKSFVMRATSGVLALLFMVGCQTIRTRKDVPKQPVPRPGQPTPPVQIGQPPIPDRDEEDEMAEVPPAPPPPPAPVIPSMPKIGIILGGGGAKTFAHIGFLHELTRAKVPVQAIGGVEFAAPMAALYANKGLANDVEWQMFKLKDEEVLKKSLLGAASKNVDVTNLRDFLNVAFNRAKPEDFRVPFACPANSLKKNQVYLMNRGSVDQVMFQCIAYPPFFKPYEGTVAGVRDITALANYLRSKGANFIVFVNVLQPPSAGKAYVPDASGTDNVLWAEIAGSYSKPLPGIDSVVSLETSGYGIMDFDKRREIMAKGADSAARQLKTLTRKWGL